MKYDNVFTLISELSKKCKITCILIGGFALNYYKVTRQTVDVDFLITKECLKKIINHLMRAGYKINELQAAFIQLSNKKNDLMDLDFMIVEKETFDKIIKDAEKIKIAGRQFLIPSLLTLIALKLHSIKNNQKIREMKDLPDILNLIRINNINYKEKKFRSLCLQYGTKEIYEKIKQSL